MNRLEFALLGSVFLASATAGNAETNAGPLDIFAEGLTIRVPEPDGFFRIDDLEADTPVREGYRRLVVLAPEGGIRYYFIENVAPINHLIAPALSVVSLLFLEKTAKLRWRIILYPAAVSLAYGLICLALNAAGILDGPYFFLEAGKQPAGTIVMWFAIIALICIVFAALYYRIKWRKKYI